MTREAKEDLQRRADLAASKELEFEALQRDAVRTHKDTLTKDLALKPSLRHQEFYSLLLHNFGAENVTMLDRERRHHGKSMAGMHLAIPDMIVYPHTSAQVQWLTSFADARKIPLIPYGMGSSLEGSIGAVHDGGICLDMSRMNRVIHFNPEDHQIRVQAGITKCSLDEYLKDSGLYFPLDISYDASIGGMMATNASGSGIFYNSAVDAVSSLTAVLANGTVINSRKAAHKASSGYDLKSLFIGSEGTLAVITEVTLKLLPVPKAITCGIATFSSLSDAIDTAVHLIRNGADLRRCQILDRNTISTLNVFHQASFAPVATLFLEAHGNARASADLTIEECKDACRERGLLDFTQFTDEDGDSLMLWRVRATVWTAVFKTQPESEVMVLDLAVPRSRLAELVQEIESYSSNLSISKPLFVINAFEGSVMALIPVSREEKSAQEQAKQLIDLATKRALEMDGSCSAHHGIGVSKREYLESELGRDTVRLMRAVKRVLDPNCILNPGKIFI